MEELSASVTQPASQVLDGFLRKLERRCSLPAAEREALLQLPVTVRDFQRSTPAIYEDMPACTCPIVLSGLVSRQKKVDDTRKIVAFCFPGDAVDLQALFFNETDHTVVTHGPTSLAYVNHSDLIALSDRYPLLAKLFWYDTLIEAAIFREWTVNVGHRRAVQRIGHLLLEFQERLQAIGEIDMDSYDLPLTQAELADAVGLSLVHFNKSLRVLRLDNLVSIRGHKVIIHDRAALIELTKFNEDYLHLYTPPAFEKPAAGNSV